MSDEHIRSDIALDEDYGAVDQADGDDDFRFIPRWVWTLAWPLVILAGIIVIERTAHPVLGTLIICSKASWGNIATAFWLRRRDPRPERGRTLFWFILAWAIAKVFIWSLVLLFACMILIGICESTLFPILRRQGFAVAPIDPALETLFFLMVVFMTFFPILILTGIGCVQARRRQIKVWTDSSLNQARRERFWPPKCDAPSNEADRTILTAKCILVYLMMTNLGACIAFIPHPVGAIVAITVPLIVWRVAARLGTGVIARSAEECWPEVTNQANVT